jgi:hypothetical protein
VGFKGEVIENVATAEEAEGSSVEEMFKFEMASSRDDRRLERRRRAGRSQFDIEVYLPAFQVLSESKVTFKSTFVRAGRLR